MNKWSYEIIGLTTMDKVSPGDIVAWAPRETMVAPSRIMGIGGWQELSGLNEFTRPGNCEVFATFFSNVENAAQAAKLLGVDTTSATIEGWYASFMARPFNIAKVASVGGWSMGKKVSLFLVRLQNKVWRIVRSDETVFLLAQKPKEKKVKNSENAYRSPAI